MILVVIILILLSATFSGLTIGMFSLSPEGLERKIKLGDKRAEKVYDIRKHGNFLLCTLLLGNVAVNSSISVVMADLTSGGLVAGLLATAAIFVFGEVLPQATFSRYALEVGARTAWIVKVFMVLMYIVAKPLSMLLDFFLGKEMTARFNKKELQALIEEHEYEGDSPLDTDERRIIIGAMNFSQRQAIDVITPVTVVYRLEDTIVMTDEWLKRIKDEHYSRIPVFSNTRDNIVGILFAKDLIGFDVSENKTVGDLCRRDELMFIKEDHKLDSLLNLMTNNKVHMSFVFDQYDSLRGIVTLEDIVEEIINKQILDESDTEADLQHFAKQKIQRVITEE